MEPEDTDEETSIWVIRLWHKTEKVDPIYWLISLCCIRFIKAGLVKWERDFVTTNIRKHRRVIWLNLIATCLIFWGLHRTDPIQIPVIISALLAPAMVTGGAWFAITFGGIPSKLLRTAVDITFFMFLAFTLSMRIMVSALMFITPGILWPIFLIIEIGVIVACIMYDNADGLKLGLDDTLLRHSRAALSYYVDQGYVDLKDLDQDVMSRLTEKSFQKAKLAQEKEAAATAKTEQDASGGGTLD